MSHLFSLGGKKRPLAGQNEPPPGQNGPPPGQNGPFNIKHDHLYINVIVPILTGQRALKYIFVPPGSINRAFLLQKWIINV